MTLKHTFYLVLISCFGFFSCNNANSTKNSTGVKDTVVQVPKDSLKEIVATDSLEFPSQDSFTVKVLPTGYFHGDEVWENANKLSWFGLFKNDSVFYMAPTKVKTSRFHDEIEDDDENAKTGWHVTTTNKDTCWILIEPQQYLKESKIETVQLAKDHVKPGDTLTFSFQGIEYKIFATGTLKNAEDDYSAFNYKLYLTSDKSGQQKPELLVAHTEFVDQITTIMFAGDIDGDGLLDLIIDASYHYDASLPTIYLSKPAENGHLLKVMGGHGSVGC